MTDPCRRGGYPDEDWLAKWAPPCPDGNPQRLLEILGFRLKGADYLQLRVVLRRGENGVCQAIVDEQTDRLYVRALACATDDEAKDFVPPWLSEETNCPCNIWLDAPLGDRTIIDVDSGEELPLYVPRWGTGEPSLYIARPPGPLWPPADMPRAG